MQRIAIIGTGLIGTSIALALRRVGFDAEIVGIDKSVEERSAALRSGCFNWVNYNRVGEYLGVRDADLVILATPVLAILDWMEKLSPILGEHQFVTDVGSTKLDISEKAKSLFNKPGTARFLPGHPMAGKEFTGAVLGDAELFQNAMWLFTPISEPGPPEEEWRRLVQQMGARTRDLDPQTHDEVCAWVSHLPQMLSTALAALLEDTFAADPEGLAAVKAIGGRALRETTRLGASPYSMWRDIALTNTDPIAQTLSALEQRLAHLRENLRTPELREEFTTANRFRQNRD